MRSLPSPVKVSPLIKFFRYTFLIAGIIYGATKRRAYQAKEAGRKEERERLELMRNTQMMEEKKIAADIEIAEIAAIFSGESAPKFEKRDAESPEAVNVPCIVEKVKLESDGIKPVVQIDKADSITVVDESCAIISNEAGETGPKDVSSADSRAEASESECLGNPESTRVNEYFVEKFTSKVPYATPDNVQFDPRQDNRKK